MPDTDPPTKHGIRLAETADYDRVRELIPDAFRARNRPILFVATGSDTKDIVGATGMLRRRASDPEGYRVTIGVDEASRGRGVGRALIDRCAVEARSRGVAALYAWRMLDEGDPVLQAWQGLGFREEKITNKYQAGIQPLVDLLRPLHARLEKQGKIPTGEYRCVPISEANTRHIVQLHLWNLGGRQERLRRRLAGEGSMPFDQDLSRAWLLDEKVIGVALCRWEERPVMLVDAVIVPKSHRNGWANVVVKLDGAENALSHGAEKISFVVHEKYQDTRKIAKRLDAEVVLRKILHYRLIEGPASGGQAGQM